MEDKAHKNGKAFWNEVSGQIAEFRGFVIAAVVSVLGIVRRKAVSLIIWSVLGLITAWGIWHFSSTVYEANMTVSYQMYQKKIYADMIAKLNGLAKSKQYDLLASVLDIDEEQAGKIVTLESYNIKRMPLQEDISTERVPFYIDVKVRDKALLPVLETTLVNYLNGTPYIIDRLAFMREQHTDRHQFLSDRIKMSDSITRYIITSGANPDGEVIEQLVALQIESVELHKELAEAKGALHFNANIEVLDGFVATKEKPNKSLPVFLSFGLLTGLGIRLGWMLVTGR